MSSDLQPDNMTRRAWHALASEETLREVQSREEGLNQEEARQRQEQFGPNKLPENKRAGLAPSLRPFTYHAEALRLHLGQAPRSLLFVSPTPKRQKPGWIPAYDRGNDG